MDLPPFDDVDIEMARSWLKGYTKKLAPSSISPDDLEAEGLYAMWQAYQKLDALGTNLNSYLIQAAKWHILKVLERRQWTGQEKTPQPRGVNSTGVIHADQVEQFYPDDVISEWEATSAEEPGYDTADIHDLRADVREAVSTLNDGQRDRVYRKFWLDESVWLSGNWWRDPRWGVKAVLAEKLDHLRPDGVPVG